jgi:hypothetical protein
MIEKQDVKERTNLPTLCLGQLAMAAQIRMGVFFIRSVSDTIFAMLFLLKPMQTTWQTATDHSLRNDGLDFMTSCFSELVH